MCPNMCPDIMCISLTISNIWGNRFWTIWANYFVRIYAQKRPKCPPYAFVRLTIWANYFVRVYAQKWPKCPPYAFVIYWQFPWTIFPGEKWKREQFLRGNPWTISVRLLMKTWIIIDCYCRRKHFIFFWYLLFGYILIVYVYIKDILIGPQMKTKGTYRIIIVSHPSQPPYKGG